MHTILKSILRLVKIAVLMFISFHGYCNDEVIAQYVSEQKLNSMTLEDNILESSHYTDGVEEKLLNRNMFDVDVRLTVKQIDSRVLAKISFTNLGGSENFIHRRLLPISSHTSEPYFFSPLCEDSFLISTSGFYLKFRPSATNICDFFEDDANDELYFGMGDNCDIKSEWVKLSSGETKVFTVNLNEAYSFLPGSHWYTFKSLTYRIVNNKWFFQRSINKSLFTIIDFHYPSCQGGAPYIQNINDMCEYGALMKKEQNMSNFMFDFFPAGGENRNYVDITSNKIRLKIDGSKVKTYDEIKVELLKHRYGAQWEEYKY
ncbi:hypothetical protein KYK43_000004 [Escherichia coli]|nr:hypothetical protein [Escherichia coli]EHT8276518.1 hypothetical protein [Escherichia coli]EIY9332849.1 hypothetical protein [Escherichia coli]MCV5813485.1 hypothetical protein [Escherichia coli]TGH02355.1 hypothetical protein E5S61_15240 [Escherichia coli]